MEVQQTMLDMEVEVLKDFEQKRQESTDERDRIQKKTFTKWVNKHLAKEGRIVEDLFVDLQNGRNLIALLEALTSDRLPKEHGETRFHRTQNVQVCLDYLRRRHIKLVNIRPKDIVEGNGKLTLGLIWTIILNFQVSMINQRQRQEKEQRIEQQSRHKHLHSSSTIEHRVHSNGGGVERAERVYEYEEQTSGQVGEESFKRYLLMLF
ncbi:Calponin-homology (CH) domain-containing protein [Aphelenchoides bicaudatus]|nr:Calponin-homology (CH) domain-containing protein [Aphelenchoides bicaudatus]